VPRSSDPWYLLQYLFAERMFDEDELIAILASIDALPATASRIVVNVKPPDLRYKGLVLVLVQAPSQEAANVLIHRAVHRSLRGPVGSVLEATAPVDSPELTKYLMHT
jgi:hypothetical protein